MNNILLTEKISNNTLKLANDINCSKVCALTGDKSLLGQYPEIKLISFPELDIEAQWKGWKMAEKVVEELATCAPDVFQVNGFNLKNAVIKDIWWGLFKQKGRIIRNCEFHLNKGKKVFTHTSHFLPPEIRDRVTVIKKKQSGLSGYHSKLISSAVGFSLGYDIRNKKNYKAMGGITSPPDKKIIFFPASIKNIEVFDSLIKEIGPEHFFACLGIWNVESSMVSKTQSALEKRSIAYGRVSYNHSFKRLKQFYRLIRDIILKSPKSSTEFGKEESYIIYQSLLSALFKCFLFEDICRTTEPEVIIGSGYENFAFADLLLQVAHKYDIRLVNTMNGLKIATPQNKHTRFDIWTMWSENQKKYLTEHGGIPSDQLKVTGHLMADKVSNYSYRGTMDSLIQNYPDKKFIGIFSQPQEFPGDYREKFLHTVCSYIANSTDYIGVIKCHPREKSSEIISIVSGYDNIVVLEHNEEEPTHQLYDLLHISCLSAVIYSTVAYESLFFKTPVVSLNFTGITELLPITRSGINWAVEITEDRNFESYMSNFKKWSKENLNLQNLETLIGPVDGQNARRLAKLL